MYDVPTRMIPGSINLDRAAGRLTWDPHGENLDRRDFADDGLLDRFAALSRPASPARFEQRVERLATDLGPLTWCSECGNIHALTWWMQAPGKLDPRTLMRESIDEWRRAADHINALRRLATDLRSGPGAPSDWGIVWPARTDENRLDDADIATGRRRVAHHLQRWLSSCHVGLSVRWDTDQPVQFSANWSLLGELGSRLVGELVDRPVLRSCAGVVAGEPCQVTWTVARDLAAASRPLCDACDLQRRGELHRKNHPPDVARRKAEAERLKKFRAARKLEGGTK